MTSKINKNTYITSMIGTALEYYDMSLYGFMAPILISVFLPNFDPLNALIITFVMYPIGIIAKPLGAIIIGRIGDKKGRKKALSIGIIGTAFFTGIIGLLPSYNAIGIAAPILFILCRLGQYFFAASEYNGGAIYILEHSDNQNKACISGLYCAYTVSGILAASLMSNIVSYLPEGWWRLPYFIAFFTGIFGFYIRNKALESSEFLNSEISKKIEFDKITLKNIFFLIGMAGFFGALYTMPALLMTNLIPLLSDLSTKTIMNINSLTLVIYMCALPISGRLADIIGMKKSMILATLMTAILTLPLMKLLFDASIGEIFTVKLIFALLSAWFIGPFHAFVQSMFKVNNRYSLISFSYSIGSQIGGFMPGLSLLIWKQTSNINYIAALLVFWAVIGGIGCYFSRSS